MRERDRTAISRIAAPWRTPWNGMPERSSDENGFVHYEPDEADLELEDNIGRLIGRLRERRKRGHAESNCKSSLVVLIGRRHQHRGKHRAGRAAGVERVEGIPMVRKRPVHSLVAVLQGRPT